MTSGPGLRPATPGVEQYEADDGLYWSLLHGACVGGSLDAVKAVQRLGGARKARKSRELRPGQSSAGRVSVAHGWCVTADNDYEALLVESSGQGRLELMQWADGLCQAALAPHQYQHAVDLALGYACARGSLEAADWLRQRGGRLAGRALAGVASSGRLAVAQWVGECDSPHAEFLHALTVAFRHKQIEPGLLQWLIDGGRLTPAGVREAYDAAAARNSGITPLQTACRCDNWPMVEWIAARAELACAANRADWLGALAECAQLPRLHSLAGPGLLGCGIDAALCAVRSALVEGRVDSARWLVANYGLGAAGLREAAADPDTQHWLFDAGMIASAEYVRAECGPGVFANTPALLEHACSNRTSAPARWLLANCAVAVDARAALAQAARRWSDEEVAWLATALSLTANDAVALWPQSPQNKGYGLSGAALRRLSRVFALDIYGAKK